MSGTSLLFWLAILAAAIIALVALLSTGRVVLATLSFVFFLGAALPALTSGVGILVAAAGLLPLYFGRMVATRTPSTWRSAQVATFVADALLLAWMGIEIARLASGREIAWFLDAGMLVVLGAATWLAWFPVAPRLPAAPSRTG